MKLTIVAFLAWAGLLASVAGWGKEGKQVYEVAQMGFAGELTPFN